MDLSMWRGKSICFSAVITDCMFSEATAVQNPPSWFCYFLTAAGKSKNLPTSEKSAGIEADSCHGGRLTVQ